MQNTYADIPADALSNVDECRSYATRENLLKALNKLHLAQYDPVLVCNSAGRHTAVFSGQKLLPMITLAAFHGFMTI